MIWMVKVSKDIVGLPVLGSVSSDSLDMYQNSQPNFLCFRPFACHLND